MIGGNKVLTIQIRTVTENNIGEQVEQWNDVQSIKGWIDMMTGDSNRQNFNTKIAESTHVFIGDYVSLNPSIFAENSRAVVDGKLYDILFIDNPMEMNEQLEIYLKNWK